MIENLWNDPINSPILGACEGISDEELTELIRLRDKNPVAMFGVMNRMFNKLGLCLKIDDLGGMT